MAEVPLFRDHISLGAKMAPFAGWQMPIEYPAGTLAEHHAVRNAVGLFDVSHMGKLAVNGVGALDYVNTVFTADLDRIEDGQAQYSMLCNEAGGIVDDLIVYRVSRSDIRIVPNAANAQQVFETLQSTCPANITVTNQQLTHGILAVQGPLAQELLVAMNVPMPLTYMSFIEAEWRQHDFTVCRTGYTGEQGYELIGQNVAIVAIWQELMRVGEDFGLLPCGLAARDTLRTEMGYVLHGQDISTTISPLEAGTSWAVGWQKSTFHGRDALLQKRKSGPTRKLVGLRLVDRGIPRPHMQVFAGVNQEIEQSKAIGETTSGTFSPTLQCGIALASVDSGTELGQQVQIDVRGRRLTAEVVKLPFVSSSPKQKG